MPDAPEPAADAGESNQPTPATPPATPPVTPPATPPATPPVFTPHPAEKKAYFDKKLSHRPDRFEDFDPWQEARRLVGRTFEITDRAEFAGAIAVREEIRRNAVATMSHLAAGAESNNDRDFSRGLNQAMSTAAAVRSLMYVAIDQGQLPEAEANELIGRAASLKRMIGSQIMRLKRTDTRDFNRKGPPSGDRKGKGPRGSYGAKKPYGNKKPYGKGGDNHSDRS